MATIASPPSSERPQPRKTATAGTAVQADPAPAPKPTCEKCGTTESWGRASWCPRCGYYPQFGTVVDPDGRSGWEEPAGGPVNVWEALPPWAWLCGGGVIGIFFASLFCRVVIPEESSARLIWSLLQFVIGMVATGCAQVVTYLYAVPKSDKIQPFDIFMKPIEIWKPTIKDLPRTASRVCLGAWGVTAIVCALFVTGGIPWAKAFDDWGFEKRAEKNLVQAIVDKARKERDGSDSLEESIEDFAGKGTDMLPEEPSVPLTMTDCLIVGYTKSPEGELLSLVLAAAPRGVVEIVGTMSAETIPQEAKETLLERMRGLETSKPFLKSPYSATWLRPVLMCRVGHEDWTKDRMVKKPRFDGLLKDVDQP